MLKQLHIAAQAPYFLKNSNSNIFLTNTINIIAQYTAVFSKIAHLLLHNRHQFFSHFSHCLTFSHGDRAIHPIHSTVLSKQLVGSVTNMHHFNANTGVAINWYKQAIN